MTRPIFTLSRKEEERVERRWEALREAEALIALVASEFETDPMSVQCFDLRVVERVKQCAATLKANPDFFV